ncbi:hypothetical protein BGI41_03865 [Methanobrevibacter sp. 87.7]|uniref:pseudomurein-binding repeat-containing protein n=1 Tax=Methanobrevibacter sp. 87.7 TaxID=387957 RepID=UPI000B506A96|nr:pseudomurein-binding repeat-containing protein [Methanobrevibacter sp. 87.7]OWT33156.1 hypothetical protein BGI41_03865 [Methanobrevibacter sp. 87.7]
MSKKFRYFSLLLVLVVVLCIGAVSAADVDNGTTVSMSNSSVQDSVQNVNDNVSTNSIDYTSTVGSTSNLSTTVSGDYDNTSDVVNNNVSSLNSTPVANNDLSIDDTVNDSNSVKVNNASNTINDSNSVNTINNSKDVNSSSVKPVVLKAAGSENSNSFTINQIISAAKYVKNYYASNGKLPSTVTIGSVKVSLAQFLYYESKALSQLNSDNKANIAIIGSMGEPSSPNMGDSVSGKFTKSAYVDSATRTYKFILNYKQGPNYSTTTLNRVSYNRLIEAFSVALDYYGSNGKLPDYLTLKYGSKTTAGMNPVNSVSINQIIAASKVLKEYYASNGKLPSTVMVGSVKCTLAQFLYYESRAISQLNFGNKANIAIVKALNEPSSPNLGNVKSGNLAKSAYVDSAARTYKFILNYNQGPNYSTTTLGTVSYNYLIRAFADVLVSYGNNNALPSSVAINNNANVKQTTTITVNSGDVYKKDDKYSVVLKDASGKVLANQKVQFKISGLTTVYSATTDAKGVASFIINLNSGSYTVTASFAGNGNYQSSSKSSKVYVVSNSTNGFNNNTFSIFLFGSDMNNINLATLASNHVGNVFLNYYAIEKYGNSGVENFIANARKYNINVYIWMQTFYDGTWVNPATCGQAYWTQKINEAVSYAKLNGVTGIALDYLRFGGNAYKYSNGTSSITMFTKMLTAAVKVVNPNIKVAAILMPETSQNAYYYGQDSDQLGNIVDILMPMIYKGNYQAGSSWIKSTTAYFKAHSGNAQVWTVLQSYKSDNDVTKLSASELKTDAQNALDGGADGVSYFRYGYLNYVNSTTLNGGISSMGVNDTSNNNNNSGNNTIVYNTTINGNNVTIIGGTGTYYTVVLKDQNGKVLANKKVRFSIVGVNYDVVTDSNGIAKLQINLMGDKSYDIGYLFAGDEHYNGSNGSAVIKVTKTNPSISASNVTMYYNDGSKFVVVLKDFQGKALNNQAIYLKIGNSVYKIVTNTNGQASYVVNLTPGTYAITFTYNGDFYRYSVSSTGKIVVKKLSYVIKANDYTTTNKTGYYTVSVYDNLGNKVANQYVNITIAGKLSTVKTDSNGAVKVAYTLNPGTYNVVSSIVGNNLYDGNSVTKKITVNNQPATYLTITQIIDAAKTVKSYYVAHGSLPSTVTIGSTKVTISQYLYYVSRAIAQLNTNNMANVPIIKSVDSASNPNMGDTINGNLYKAGYVDSASRTYKFILENMQAPNYSTTTLNRVSFNTLTEAFSTALVYYSGNKKLPDYLTITSGKETTAHATSTTSNVITINQVIEAAKVVKDYYAKNKKLPSSVMVGSYKCTLAQFLYYESRAIAQLNTNNMTNIPVIGSINEPSSPNMGDSIKGNLNKSGYVDSASRTYKFILENEQGPNYSTTTVGKVSYNALIEAFSRVLSYYSENKQLPAYVSIDTTTSADTSSITALAKSLTEGLTSQYDMAVTMFNWVRDNVVYDYYYNSQQGASLTLTKRSGNCCDQSNLYVAMCRSVGLTVRYVHGYCHFTDGWYGHVWTEVNVNGKWYSADCVSTRNTFGTINNWNTNTATIYNRYTNLPF